MRPTFSIIFFTVVSGAGYGLLMIVGFGIAIGSFVSLDRFPMGDIALQFPPARLALAGTLLLGAILSATGLLASLAHLGKPQRAWRALSQWRTSWLSREGVAVLLTFLPIVIIFVLLFWHKGTSVPPLPLRLCGLLLVLCCATTVVCTANIYASLKPIRAWNDPLVPVIYLSFAVYSGCLWLVALATLGLPDPYWTSLVLPNALLIAPGCAWLKRNYWLSNAKQSSSIGPGTATGLDRLGTVRSFEQPHTEENYLTHEMGFVLARKHSRTLRAFAFWSILLAPISTLLLAWLGGGFFAWPGLALGLLGVFVERWLFFAEAKHTVMAYYGR